MRTSQCVVLLIVIFWTSFFSVAAQEGGDDNAEWEDRTGFIGEERKAKGINQPDDVSGLRLWLDAGAGISADEDGRVKRWDDQSGHGNAVSGSGGASGPEFVKNAINGRPALRFEGDQDLGQTLGRQELELKGQEDALTMVLVYRANEKTFSGKVLCYGSGMGTGHVLLGVPFNVDVQKRFSSDAAGDYQIGQGYRVFTVRVNGTEGLLELFENGRQTGQRTKEPFDVKDAARLLLGARSSGRGNNRLGCRADLAEVLIYNSTLSDDQRRGVEQYLMRKYGLEAGGAVASEASKLAYAYYPGQNQLEVAFDATPFFRKAGVEMPEDVDELRDLTVRIYPVSAVQNPDESTSPAKGEPAVEREMTLSGQGMGQTIFDIPELDDGKYRVQYQIGDTTLWSSRTFREKDFAFEDCDYGLKHKVYEPFEPVDVDGSQVSVVGRTYTLNALGGLEQVVSEGRELLDGPVRLMAETDEGRVEFEPLEISGEEAHPDLAKFTTRATSEVLDITAEIRVEEDGFIEYHLTYGPAQERERARIKRLWLEMSLPDRNAPLCHLVGLDSMRYNYAGNVPEGGEIRWHNQPWRPPRWSAESFEGEAPTKNLLWNAHDLWHWSDSKFNFAPYIWLGATRRGLAWFGDSAAGYIQDGRESLQKLYRVRDDGRVMLEVDIVQHPATIQSTHTVKYGLQASPTKPAPDNWRTYDVPGGGGMSVVVWGGYYCNDKYPDPKNWKLVEEIVGGRGSGEVDREFFEKLDKQRKRPDMKVHGEKDWLDTVLMFAGREANRPNPNGTTTYFEEHVTHPIIPEFQVFRDEWVDGDFARYHSPPNWPEGDYWNAGGQPKSANSRAYRDFVVYYANQWMKRGVGVYYDNTYPKIDRHHRRVPPDAPYRSSLWGHRQYYRRVWKRSRELMEQGKTPIDPLTKGTDDERRMRLHIVGHVTNCQVLPYTTWWDATLGTEQPYQKVNGRARPFPPDYLRAMTMGQTAGLIPHARHALRNEDAFGGIGAGYGDTEKPKEEIMDHRHISDWAMGLIHGIRRRPKYDTPARALHRQVRAFGYGNEGVTVHSYWEDDPPVEAPDSVRWLAMTREKQPFGMLLLQSYQFDPLTARVEFDGAGAMLDLRTRELFEPNDGTFSVEMAKDYSTRLLLAARDPAALRSLALGEGMIAREGFEFGVSPGWSKQGKSLKLVEDTADTGNTVLRIRPGHPSRNGLQGSVDADNYVLSLRFRLPEDAAVKKLTHGILGVKTCWNGQNHPSAIEQRLTVKGRSGAEERPQIAFGYGQLNGKKRPDFQNVTLNELSRWRDARPGQWRRLRIRVEDRVREVYLDGEKIFHGETDVRGGNNIAVKPGWQLKRSGLPYVEVDDVVVKRAK